MLYDEQSASDDMKQLKAAIDQQKSRLENHGLARLQRGRR